MFTLDLGLHLSHGRGRRGGVTVPFLVLLSLSPTFPSLSPTFHQLFLLFLQLFHLRIKLRCKLSTNFLLNFFHVPFVYREYVVSNTSVWCGVSFRIVMIIIHLLTDGIVGSTKQKQQYQKLMIKVTPTMNRLP